jgi:hypothetical protein
MSGLLKFFVTFLLITDLKFCTADWQQTNADRFYNKIPHLRILR